MKKNISALLLLAAFVFQTTAFAQAPAIKISGDDRKAADGVTAKQLSEYLYFIASDAMGGRDTPSPGLDITAEFIKMNLQKWGFKPAGDDGTFFQKIALRKDTLDPLSTNLAVAGTAFTLNRDYVRVRGNGVTGDVPMVFGKDGWMVAAKNIDALAGVDVKGKIVVFAGAGFSQRYLIAPPEGVVENDLKRDDRGKAWADPITNAKLKGAAGVVVIAPETIMSFWGQVVANLSRGGMFPEKLGMRGGGDDSTPVMLVAPVVRDAIFGAGVDAAKTSLGDLKRSGSMSSNSKTETQMTQNVVAIWEGRDPVLKDEMVAIGAHYDHVGTNPNAPGPDKIFNGADDDGSGTTAVLGIAEALAKAPKRPRRSVLFVWHCGEEKGLWGSEYFNKFPTVDVKKIAAQLNIDMIGRSQDPNNIIKCDKPGKPCNEDLSKADEIYVIGKDMMSSMLGATVDGVNNAYLKLAYNTRYDDPKDKNRFFFRSDHFNYAVNGIPITFWFDGVHEDYHQPGDEPQKIDYNKMERVSRTIMLTLLQLANTNDRPKIDKQLPPELTRR